MLADGLVSAFHEVVHLLQSPGIPRGCRVRRLLGDEHTGRQHARQRLLSHCLAKHHDTVCDLSVWRLGLVFVELDQVVVPVNSVYVLVLELTLVLLYVVVEEVVVVCESKVIVVELIELDVSV